jgi:hypothetical protein
MNIQSNEGIGVNKQGFAANREAITDAEIR